MPLGLPVPISCFRSPTGQKAPIGLLLQPDSIPHRQFQPAGSRIAAATGTNNLATTAPVSRLGNGGAEQGSLGLMSPASPGTCSKFSRRWELKLRLMGDFTRCSQQTLKIHLGLSGLTGILPHHRNQFTTR
ncbi:hypothetical protein AMECASPLE_013699 [Ameca splendens]|uniref:Uncharacterized protein n=1 Tax=Ameca splendens TaxID=208324 RepID=A0ABV0XEI8_9TELE